MSAPPPIPDSTTQQTNAIVMKTPGSTARTREEPGKVDRPAATRLLAHEISAALRVQAEVAPDALTP
jgi:hypothetical protein